MNNMSSQIVHGRLLQYADDTALIYSGPTMDDDHKQLSVDLSKHSIWKQQSKMQLNTGKYSVMWFRPRSLVHHTPPDVAINGTSL